MEYAASPEHPDFVELIKNNKRRDFAAAK